MPSLYKDLLVEQGSTFNTTINLVDGNGNPKNIQSYIAYSQIKKSFFTSVVTANFNIITDSLNSSLIMWLDSHTTANIKAGSYVYDIILVSNNDIMRIFEGTVSVIPGVTIQINTSNTFGGNIHMSYTVSSSDRVGFVPTTNPIAIAGVDANGIKRDILVSSNGMVQISDVAYTPRKPSGNTSLTVSGNSQILCANGEISRGGWIKNPSSTTDQNTTTLENIYISIDSTAANVSAGGSTFSVLPGETFALPPLTTSVSWNAATAGHNISVWIN